MHLGPKPSKVYSGHYDTPLNITKMPPNLDFKEYPPSLKEKRQDSCRESMCQVLSSTLKQTKNAIIC